MNHEIPTQAIDPKLEKLNIAYRMAVTLIKIAENAGLTGRFEEGVSLAIKRYHQVLDLLEANGFSFDGFTERLPAETSFDELGVSASLLATWIEAEIDARSPALPSEEEIYSEQIEELRELGRLLRENLPAWVKTKTQTPHSEPARPRPMSPPIGPTSIYHWRLRANHLLQDTQTTF